MEYIYSTFLMPFERVEWHRCLQEIKTNCNPEYEYIITFVCDRGCLLQTVGSGGGKSAAAGQQQHKGRMTVLQQSPAHDLGASGGGGSDGGDHDLLATASSALRRLHFKSAGGSRARTKQPVPKVRFTSLRLQTKLIYALG